MDGLAGSVTCDALFAAAFFALGGGVGLTTDAAFLAFLGDFWEDAEVDAMEVDGSVDGSAAADVDDRLLAFFLVG